MLLLPPALSSLLLLALPSAVRATFRDEVGHIDYHHELLGLPQRETTFFHRPRRDDKASLLYTLSDVGVLGAVNPSTGAIVWRQLLNGTTTDGGGFARAGEGESWVASALGGAVHGWDAVSGRNRFWAEFDGAVRDLEVMEMTEGKRKDVLVLVEEDEGAALVRRLNADDGSMVWEFRETTKDVPLQVSTNVEKVFAISLRGAPGSYNLRVAVLDTLTGKKVDEILVGAKGDIVDAGEVMFVGANSAAPVVAWTDESLSKLRLNVLGTKNRQEFPLAEGTISVEIHAPHLVQSQPHFLVHSRTKEGNRAEVYHVDLKSNAISKAYDLPLLTGPGAFSTSSSGANVFFTRITEDEMILLSSTSHAVLARWPLKAGEAGDSALHAVSEVIKKSGAQDTYAVRSAAVTNSDDWVLVQNGKIGWVRFEGMSGGVAATFAEIPDGEELAKTLEQEAHSNPLEAYIHRVKRHINDLQYLPAYLQTIPPRVLSSVLGTEVTTHDAKLFRDGFGFNKLVILATKRGRMYGLDAGNNGRVLWNTKVFDFPTGQQWDVKGIQVEDSKGQVTVRGADGAYVIVKIDTGKIIEVMPAGSWPPVQSTALVDSASGPWLLPIGVDGQIGDIPPLWTPKQTVVVRGLEGELKGIAFVPAKDGSTTETTAWTFVPPSGQTIVNIATRSPHDPVASIGRVLGDRGVKYKYLNPNTVVVAAVNPTTSTLTAYVLDTVSGEILSATTYEGIDSTKPVECALSENWHVCTYFGQYKLVDSPTQSLKGYQITVSDLYESDLSNDRGPLGDAANFSSLHPIDLPTGPARPAVVSQTFILGAHLEALQVSQTRQGITTRELLAYVPDTHSIVGIPRTVLEPRRPVGRDPTAAEVEEGLMRYFPALEIDPKLVVTHERDVLGIKRILTAPAVVESTSLVFAFGVDVFGTRVAPSFTFDILGKGFNKVSLVGTVVALAVGVYVLGPVVRRKQINARWKAPK